MAIIGGLRLVGGLAFMGTVIASCLWLLNRLFPDTSNTSYHLNDDASWPTSPAQPPTAAGEHKEPKTSGVAQKSEPQNPGEIQDERIVR